MAAEERQAAGVEEQPALGRGLAAGGAARGATVGELLVLAQGGDILRAETEGGVGD